MRMMEEKTRLHYSALGHSQILSKIKASDKKEDHSCFRVYKTVITTEIESSASHSGAFWIPITKKILARDRYLNWGVGQRRETETCDA